MICSSGKKGYTERGVLDMISIIKKKEGVMLDAYVCPECLKWHLTHGSGSKKKVTKKRRKRNSIRYK